MEGSLSPRIKVLAALLSFLGSGQSLSAAPPDPLAFVAEIDGRVDVARVSSKAIERAVLGLALRRGDKVQIGPASKAKLLLKDGSLIELPEKTAFTVSVNAPSGKGASDPVMAGIFKSVSRGVVGGSRATGLVSLGKVRGSEQTELILAPRQTEILEDRPSFRWRKVKGAARYKIKISGGAGEIWQRETSDSLLAYPADTPPLARSGDFLLDVRAMTDHGAVRGEETGFRIKSTAESDEIQRHIERIQGGSGNAGAYLIGAYFASKGLYLDAARVFEELSQKLPDEPGPHEALGHVYRAVGLTDLSAAAFQRALELTRKS